VLDLSYISPAPTYEALSSLLSPAASRVPSLRVLGLRSESDPGSTAVPTEGDERRVQKRLIKELVRDSARTRSIEIIWD
jgi:hypothetical protein